MVAAVRWEPEESDIEWLRSLFTLLKEGGIWIAPITGQMFKKDKESLILINEGIPDSKSIFERSKEIGLCLGIKVIKQSEVKGGENG